MPPKIDYKRMDEAVRNLPDCTVKSDECGETAEYRINGQAICRTCVPDWIYEHLEMGAEETATIEAIIKMADYEK